MSEIKNLIELLEKGGFRSACDWLCLKRDATRLKKLLEEMKKADSSISDPEQKKLFEQGILVIQMSLEARKNPDRQEISGGEREPGKGSLPVN